MTGSQYAAAADRTGNFFYGYFRRKRPRDTRHFLKLRLFARARKAEGDFIAAMESVLLYDDRLWVEPAEAREAPYDAMIMLRDARNRTRPLIFVEVKNPSRPDTVRHALSDARLKDHPSPYWVAVLIGEPSPEAWLERGLLYLEDGRIVPMSDPERVLALVMEEVRRVCPELAPES